ncbi:hypothetical protein Hdeb2414_s0011g00359461 [Helianthus debilis subsp. tardiflorus]
MLLVVLVVVVLVEDMAVAGARNMFKEAMLCGVSWFVRMMKVYGDNRTGVCHKVSTSCLSSKSFLFFEKKNGYLN